MKSHCVYETATTTTTTVTTTATATTTSTCARRGKMQRGHANVFSPGFQTRACASHVVEMRARLRTLHIFSIATNASQAKKGGFAKRLSLSPSLYSHFICGASLAHSLSLSLSNCGGGCLIVSLYAKEGSLSLQRRKKVFSLSCTPLSDPPPLPCSYCSITQGFFLPVVFRQLFRTVVNVIVIVRL